MTTTSHQLSERTRGWLRHLWRKSVTPDDWTRQGEPHVWWDRYSFEPMLSFPRFDLSESSYALLLMGRRTPAWREVYTEILDALVRRHTTFWAAVDWLTQFGPDPDRANYPKRYKRLIPPDLWGQYDVPGWTANGIEPWGLQPDPIGSDGNLFFRGFFTLLLGIHRAVSGEDTWEKPFDVVGLEDRTFPWTHGGIAQFLNEQWQKNPGGPHCENTKVWPYCLSAAGLGLQMTDLTTGSRTHGVYDQWVEDFLRKKYMGFAAGGKLEWVAFYYDPLLERVQGNNRFSGLAPAFYVLPQQRELGELLYREAVGSVGWSRRLFPVLNPGGEPRMLSLAMLMAREFGDHTTERRIARKLGRFENGRFFDGSGDAASSDGRADQADEFGYFFHYDEPWPRGQESALLILRELLDGEGAWWRAFNESDAEKFSAPTVEGVDYPRLGIAAAHNAAGGTLHVETYAASRGERGLPTSFRVTQLPDANSVTVERDGARYENWRATGPDAIEIETQLADHTFSIHTGYRPQAVAAGSTAATASARTGAPTSPNLNRTRVSPLQLASARAALAGASGCPCC